MRGSVALFSLRWGCAAQDVDPNFFIDQSDWKNRSRRMRTQQLSDAFTNTKPRQLLKIKAYS